MEFSQSQMSFHTAVGIKLTIFQYFSHHPVKLVYSSVLLFTVLRFPCINYAIIKMNLPQTVTGIAGFCGKVVVISTFPFGHGDPSVST